MFGAGCVWKIFGSAKILVPDQNFHKNFVDNIFKKWSGFKKKVYQNTKKLIIRSTSSFFPSTSTKYGKPHKNQLKINMKQNQDTSKLTVLFSPNKIPGMIIRNLTHSVTLCRHNIKYTKILIKNTNLRSTYTLHLSFFRLADTESLKRTKKARSNVGWNTHYYWDYLDSKVLE